MLELYFPSLGLGEPIEGAEAGFGPMDPFLRGDLPLTGSVNCCFFRLYIVLDLSIY